MEILIISAAIATPLIVLFQRNVHLSLSLRLVTTKQKLHKDKQPQHKKITEITHIRTVATQSHRYRSKKQHKTHRATDTDQRNNTKHTEPQIQIKETTQNKRGALHKTSPPWPERQRAEEEQRELRKCIAVQEEEGLMN